MEAQIRRLKKIKETAQVRSIPARPESVDPDPQEPVDAARTGAAVRKRTAPASEVSAPVRRRSKRTS